MNKFWLVAARTLVGLLLVLAVIGSAYGLAVLGYDLLDGAGEWDGLGIVIGLVILLVTVPATVLCLVLLRVLRRSESTPVARRHQPPVPVRRSPRRAASARGSDARCRG